MNVGAFSLSPAVMVAPMAGVTDLPFRETVHDFGRVWVEGEMVSANPDLLESNESERKIAFGDEPSPRIVQLLGAVPAWMNRAASFVEECGADIIDINMGCPAKKICKTDCGSALMKNLPLADEIIRGVCGTVSVPVTLKMRTGWDSDHLNAPELARIAESAGVRLITVHGRTREQGYSGEAEYRTIREIRSAVRIPVIANGDIDSPQKAASVLDFTGADGIMVGRGALGAPWLPGRISAYLETGVDPGEPSVQEKAETVFRHLKRHLDFYGEKNGIRSFRKHLLWYLERFPGGTEAFRPLSRLSNTSELVSGSSIFLKKTF